MMTHNKVKTSVTSKVVLFVVFVVWLAYAYLSFHTPTAAAMSRFGLSLEGLNLLKLSVTLPLLIIWGVIAYSASKVDDYARTIEGSLDGEGFALLAWGFYTFLFSSILSSFISLIIQFNSNPDPTAVATTLRIVNSYISIALSFFGYLFVFLGTRKFIRLTRGESLAKKQNGYGYGIVFVAAVIYTILVFNNPLRTFSPISSIQPTYGVSDPLIMTTIILPTIITWLFGILSISNLMIFKRKTSGSIYKQALEKFYTGFIIVISLLIVLNFITQFSTYFATAGLKNILLFIYVILSVILLGYTYIAKGSHKLHKLELV